MKEEELKIDRKCHAIYTKKCKEIILDKIKLHYDEKDIDKVFEDIQHQYEKFLDEFNHKNLGGSKNFHNKLGGTYDCIMIVCYYVVCKDKTSFEEIEKMTEDLATGSLNKLSFVDLDKPVIKHLMYFAFKQAEKRCIRWKDYDMHLDPYSDEKPLHYTFTKCPFADFIHQFGLEEIAGALCNVDYLCMNVMNVKLVRKHACIESDHCDYTFYSKNDKEVLNHPEYRDENGFIRNK